MCTYAEGKGHEKSQGLIRVSVPGYVMVSILFDDPDKLEFVDFTVQEIATIISLSPVLRQEYTL